MTTDPSSSHTSGVRRMSQLLPLRPFLCAGVALFALIFTLATTGQEPAAPPAPAPLPGAPPVAGAPVIGLPLAAAPSVDISGRWVGTWDDLGTGHHGPLC